MVSSPGMVVQNLPNKTGKLNPGQVISTAKGNVQVLYQLPPNMVVSSNVSTNNQHIVVQNSDGKNMATPQRFNQVTQFFLPQSHGNVTYMVVSNKNKMTSAVQSPPNQSAPISSVHPQGTPLSSPPTLGVSQILANVSKTALVSDIDSPKAKSTSNSNAGVRYDYEHKHSPQSYAHAHDKDGQRSQFDPMRPVVQTNEKGHQMHVHKVHHGNARVKYVEFKPVPDGCNSPQQLSYQQYFQTGGNTGQQHLTVQTQGQAPRSPLHSPPALRPPPALPPRSIALHSPPSLIASPEVRPRFDYQSNQTVRSPVQVTSFVNSKSNNLKSVSQVLNLPRLPIGQQTPLNNSNKPTILQAFRSPIDGNGKILQSSGKSKDCLKNSLFK